MAKGNAKKKKDPAGGRTQYMMRIVTSDRCAVCPTPCARGVNYLNRVSEPGAVGNGIPCVLTRMKVST
ncbi:hypothetical protein M3650_00340 [Paenibacillus sp. MER TA 81-3]|uniref:hypothetical protein n=1 Tax=Paenibacillus sp. MER TA 81-3 TaxID=2939573 RepID=UPI00203A503D|nr:hypothetical protein [Paenibacillus sp. MER TA 81-3]MCM3337126.1 hypothetical protein [Paenibacillus sp. MER TA 81-3]